MGSPVDEELYFYSEYVSKHLLRQLSTDFLSVIVHVLSTESDCVTCNIQTHSFN